MSEQVTVTVHSIAEDGLPDRDDMSDVDFGELRKAAMDAVFDPAYRVSRCGQQSAHGPHVVRSGPDQPRNCPGGPAWSWSFVPAAVPAVPAANGSDQEAAEEN